MALWHLLFSNSHPICNNIIFPSCTCTTIPRMCYRIYICFSINIRFSSSYKFRYSIAGKLFINQSSYYNHRCIKPQTDYVFRLYNVNQLFYFSCIICQYLSGHISRILISAIAQITIAEKQIWIFFLVNFIFTKQFKVSDNIFIRL